MATDSYPQSHGSLAGLSGTDHHPQYPYTTTGAATSRPTGPWRFGRLYYANDTSVLSFDQGAGWLDLLTQTTADTRYLTQANAASTYKLATAKTTIRIPHTFTISGAVAVASGDTYYVPPFFVAAPSGQTATLVGVTCRIRSGTNVVFSLQRNDGAMITGSSGYTGLTATTTDTSYPSTLSGADAPLADRDRVSLVVTSVTGSPYNLTVTLFINYTA